MVIIEYEDIHGKTHCINENSTFTVNVHSPQYDFVNWNDAVSEYIKNPPAAKYYIDYNEVTKETYNATEKMAIKIYKKGTGDNVAKVITSNSTGSTGFNLSGSLTMDLVSKYFEEFKNEFSFLPKIVDYKFIPESMVTIITWSDGSVTKVHGTDDTATQFGGFTAAIAKKAFGNGGKMLSEWDKLVVKPIEDAKKAEKKAKIEAEKKAVEDKIHAESKAKRDKKKAERKKQREIDVLAREYADWYRENEIRDAALKLATEKYGVPVGYFKLGENGDCCYCHSHDDYTCKEYNVMDDDSIID